MNILYVSISFPKEEEGDNLYTDLAEELSNKHKVTVMVAEEKKKIKDTQIKNERGMEVLRVKTGNMYNVGLVEKAISYITLQSQLKLAIKKYLKDRSYDMVIFTAPPVTLTKVVKYAMKRFKCISYLMQKDIFPQNAVDIGILKKWNPAYWYFKLKEKEIYKISTKIGCMSQGNIDYLLENNKFLTPSKLELFPNTIKLVESEKIEYIDIKKKYGIPEKSVIALYGGNFGKPQKIEFIEEVINQYKTNENVTFIFCGKGTEKEKLFGYISNNDIKNAIMIDYLPKAQYNSVLKQTDIGLIFLDDRFTIPNIPSRTLAYLEYSIPIMAATDRNTDYKDIIQNNKFGLWCESNNIADFKEKFDYLIENETQRKIMGKNGREFLTKNWTTDRSVDIIENTYNNLKRRDDSNV